MEINPEDIELLQQKLAALQQKQASLDTEFRELKSAIDHLTSSAKPPAVPPQTVRETNRILPPPAPVPDRRMEAPKPAQKPVDLERFIGENLSNKIGAIITVLGVAIGLKYAIDNNLIGPLTRIIMGYSIATAMFVISHRLRRKYLDLSAVILSGAVCIAYFSTYAAHVFYHLIPQEPAFVIMLLITAATVWQALAYNRQIIAIGGLVGAYFIPFLLSDGSDRPVFLFVYMSLINCGILYIALRRSWSAMRFIAFFISWWVLAIWCFDKGNVAVGLAFTSLFFVIFTTIYVAEKFHLKVPHKDHDSLYLIFNGLFYIIPGYYLTTLEHNELFSGLFIFANMAAYLGLSYAFFQRFGQARPFGLLTIMGIICVTLFFTDQFDNPVLTICWSAELVILFWIGRSQNLAVYKKAIIPFLVLLGFDILLGVTPGYYFRTHLLSPLRPFLNEYSLSYVAVIAAIGTLYLMHQKHRYDDNEAQHAQEQQYFSGFSTTLLVMMGGLTYLYFFNEISAYFDIAYANSLDQNTGAHFDDIPAFKVVWLINYTLLFLGILNLIAVRKKVPDWSKELFTSLSVLGIFLFIVPGLYLLGYLKNCYMFPEDTLYERTTWHLGFRYVSICFLGWLIYTFYRLLKNASGQVKVLSENFDLILHGTALWLVGSELVHWLELNGLGDRSYKIALSILFGCWSVMLTISGMRQNRKNLRIAAIVLFAATLLKLFLYDLQHLSTISKTVVMVSLGGLLLAISYLYNKFKEEIL